MNTPMLPDASKGPEKDFPSKIDQAISILIVLIVVTILTILFFLWIEPVLRSNFQQIIVDY
jgi:hypothetical protein